MTGCLYVIGLGPGDQTHLTGAARDALAACSDFFGYAPYLDRLTLRADQRRYASDNREELARAKDALAMAAGGARVALVSGGDPGVFAMAAAACEAIEHGPAEWRALDIEIIPGVTAMLAVAALAGAPLGHDFCAISLSDNLKPWAAIDTRLRAAAGAGFVIAIYNPASRARPDRLDDAFCILRAILPPTTPVIFGRAAGRADQKAQIVDLANARGAMADMATCVIVGSPETRLVTREGKSPLVYTPRFSTMGTSA